MMKETMPNVAFFLQYQVVNNKNTKEFKIMYKKVSVTSWNTVTLSTSNYSIDTTRIIQNIDTESEYNFKILATDFFGFSEYSHNLSTAYTLMDFKKNEFYKVHKA